MKQQWNVLNVDLIKLQQNSSIDSLYIASFNDAVTLGLIKQKRTEICKCLPGKIRFSGWFLLVIT